MERSLRQGSADWHALGRGARLFRLAHAGWSVLNLAALGHVWLSALRGRDRYLRASTGLLLAEGAALLIGRGNCPFAPLQARLGDPVPLFELVLPPRAAKAAIPLLSVVALAGVAAAISRAPGRGSAGGRPEQPAAR
ncbi:MAG TPA: hypothetical protein VNW68_04250 [Candidatus Limnocylindria bacterium]|nr:hypothetical protein [Candidatus Limnocylindria bacterium]